MNILSDKIVTTRKKHACGACGRIFEKGTKMRTQVNTLDGIQTWRECPTCQILLDKHRSHFEDDYDHICYTDCVSERLEREQTPEELLSALEYLKQQHCQFLDEKVHISKEQTNIIKK